MADKIVAVVDIQIKGNASFSYNGFEAVKLLAAAGVPSVIFSSHDLPQSFSVSDKVCLLKKGRLVAEGGPESLAADCLQMKDVMGIALGKSENKKSVYGYLLTK